MTNQLKPLVYIETSVVSYLTARPNQNVVAAGKQALTAQWWDSRRGAFVLVTSQFVIDEAQSGDADAAARRLQALADIPLVEGSAASMKLAADLAHRMGLTARANPDAVHIALAASNGIQYLLTWNCTHIANASLRPIIEQTCRAEGFEPPVICTPEELLNE